MPADRFSVDFAGLTLLQVYRVEEKLAEGGMGSIYLATDTNLDRPVVVKVPHPRFLGEPAFRDRFSREVEELIRLEHPHVVRILARGEHEDVPYFVLQYLGGGSLEDRLEGADRSPDAVLEWLETVAETLDHVHGQGIVHRDVKPANILFDEAGNVFLSDFGVAKVVDADSGITGTGVGIGSPEHMAPEQGTGTSVGAPADQYALASTVYQALAGRPPFESENPLHALVEKSRSAARPLTSVAPGVPRGAAAAVMKALARDPARRFPSCAAFARSYRAGLVPRRSGVRPLLAVALVALLAGALGLIAFLAGGPDEPAGGPRIVLLDHGAEPRQVLRCRAAPGSAQGLAMIMGMKMTTGLSGEAPVTREPPRETMESEVHVGEAGEVIPLRWVITSGPRSGATANGLLTRGGILESLTFESKDGRTAEERADLERIAAVLRQLPVALPDEPVGVGATWEMTETVGLLGSRMVQTARYHLVKREGDLLHLGISSAEVAPPRELPSLGPGLDVRISTFLATGKGTTVLDLGKPFPVTSSYHLTMKMSGELKGKPVTITIELTTDVESR